MHIRFLHSHHRSLGLQYLAAVLESAGHSADLLLDLNLLFPAQENSVLNKLGSHRKRIIREVLRGKPDLVGFSVISNNIDWAFAMAQEIKAVSSVPIVFGGFHATLLPEVVVKHDSVDYTIVGEGEFALLDLVNALQNKRPVSSIKNVWLKEKGAIISNDLRPPIEDLDSLPFPDHGLIL